jgi:O-acetyl-ADP-ribose deacetylase (regulator of RNase III)
MEIIHVKGDLFNNNVKEPYYYAHCISADFALGAGIAVQFDKKFNLRSQLLSKYPKYNNWFARENKDHQYGDCILDSGVLNLVTKTNYWNKPTRKSVREALEKAKEICNENGISTICMPKIAAGLDRRPWKETEEDIRSVWNGEEIKIYVFTK